MPGGARWHRTARPEAVGRETVSEPMEQSTGGARPDGTGRGSQPTTKPDRSGAQVRDTCRGLHEDVGHDFKFMSLYGWCCQDVGVHVGARFERSLEIVYWVSVPT